MLICPCLLVPNRQVYFLILLHPVHKDTMRLESGLDGEKLVHALKRDSFCLGYQEEDKGYREQHEACEEHVYSVAHGGKHLGCEARDDEVPEPVVCRSECLTQGAGLLAVHLRVDDPWSTVPRRGVEGGPEVEEEDCADTAGGEFARGVLVVRWVSDLDVGSDVPHAQRSTWLSSQ